MGLAWDLPTHAPIPVTPRAHRCLCLQQRACMPCSALAPNTAQEQSEAHNEPTICTELHSTMTRSDMQYRLCRLCYPWQRLRWLRSSTATTTIAWHFPAWALPTLPQPRVPVASTYGSPFRAADSFRCTLVSNKPRATFASGALRPKTECPISACTVQCRTPAPGSR